MNCFRLEYSIDRIEQFIERESSLSSYVSPSYLDRQWTYKTPPSSHLLRLFFLFFFLHPWLDSNVQLLPFLPHSLFLRHLPFPFSHFTMSEPELKDAPYTAEHSQESINEKDHTLFQRKHSGDDVIVDEKAPLDAEDNKKVLGLQQKHFTALVHAFVWVAFTGKYKQHTTISTNNEKHRRGHGYQNGGWSPCLLSSCALAKTSFVCD